MQRPGGLKITEKAFERMTIPKGAKILEIGCGEGDTIAYLREKGYDVTGIDINIEAVRKAKEKNPGADIRFGDGEWLEDFSSYTFDCVVMECVLSLINIPDEALHEIYCVLKKGGKLFISDLLVREPSEELIKALDIEAKRQSLLPHSEGDCGSHDSCEGECEEIYIPSEHEAKFVNFRSCGRLLEKPLREQLEEIGYKNIYFEDFSDELKSYIAQQIMDNGKLESCGCTYSAKPADKHKTGYFMMTAMKPL